jgi:hypothetical protein
MAPRLLLIAIAALFEVFYFGVCYVLVGSADSPGATGNIGNTSNGHRANNSNQATDPTRSRATPPSGSSTNSQGNSSTNERDVISTLEGWSRRAEAIDLEGCMTYYAAKIDYYNKPGASHAYVRDDKSRAYNKFTSMSVTLSNIDVDFPSTDTAVVVLDKAWDFSGGGSSTSGKVKQRLTLNRLGSKWLISGEKDMSVYYKN